MRLAELTPAERRFLDSPGPPADNWSPLLTQRLTHLLSARLKQPVALVPVPPESGRSVSNAPHIVWNSALDVLWLHARLGGRGRPLHSQPCTALTRNLQHSLQRTLAETWLSAQHDSSPHSLCWCIETRESDNAVLTIHFPAVLQMTQWAQREIAA